VTEEKGDRDQEYNSGELDKKNDLVKSEGA
jgi:hypothetical protein